MGRAFRCGLMGSALLLLSVVHCQRNAFRTQQGAVRPRPGARARDRSLRDLLRPGRCCRRGDLAGAWRSAVRTAVDRARPPLSGRQPIVLYGSHRRFEQTNVYDGLIEESTGGFTDARKRRIVLPFAASLPIPITCSATRSSTPFSSISRAATVVPRGAAVVRRRDGRVPDARAGRSADRDVDADAVLGGGCRTSRMSIAALFPYRWGAALWAYLVERFGATTCPRGRSAEA